jgi:hypothetical protein
MSRSRARSWPRRRRRTAARTSCTARRAGDELPEELRTSAGRRAALRRAREELERERATEQVEARTEAPEGVAAELDPARFVTRAHGRRAWLREGRRALD